MQTWFIRLMLLLIVAIVVIAVISIANPDWIKVTPQTLSYSLTEEVGGGSSAEGETPEPCHRGGGAWRCFVYDNSGSGDGPVYRVEMRNKHCWKAEQIRSGGKGGLPKRAEGCVTEYDLPD